MSLPSRITGAVLINLVINPWCKILGRHCLSLFQIFLPEARQRTSSAKAGKPRATLLGFLRVLPWSIFFWLLCFDFLAHQKAFCSSACISKCYSQKIIFLRIRFLIYSVEFWSKRNRVRNWNVWHQNHTNFAQCHRQRSDNKSPIP